MQRHTRIYLRFFGFGMDDFVPCEICGQRAVDVHHIDARGMGGDPTKNKDLIENLMGLCRRHHEQYGDKEQFVEFLKKRHKEYLELNHETGNPW